MKGKPDIDFADVFDDVEDERRILKHSHPFIPYEECGASNEFNPEFMFILQEEKELNKKDEDLSFIIKTPNQQIGSSFLPITIDLEEPILELIPCNAKLKINEPHQLGVGKSKQLRKLHYGRR